MNNNIAIRSGWDRLRYALMFELLLLLLTGLALAYIADRNMADMLGLAAVLSGIALIVNLLYNYTYDRIDAYRGRIPTQRTLGRRVVHAVGFEAILMLTALPILMWWLNISLWQAVLLDLGMMSAVVVYTFLFTFAYDKYFPLMQHEISNQANGQPRA